MDLHMPLAAIVRILNTLRPKPTKVPHFLNLGEEETAF